MNRSESQNLKPETSVTGERSKSGRVETGKKQAPHPARWAFFPVATRFENCSKGAFGVYVSLALGVFVGTGQAAAQGTHQAPKQGTSQSLARGAPNAATSAPIVVVQSRQHAEFGRRLRGYLQGSTWVLEENEGNAATVTSEGGQPARAVIWIELRPGASVFEVHLLDVRTAQETVREVPFEEGAGPDGESAALEAAALIAGAVLEDWHSAERETESKLSGKPLEDEPPEVPAPLIAPSSSPAQPTGKLAMAAPLTGSEQRPVGVTAAYLAFLDGSVVRQGPAAEVAWLGSWYLGVQVSWTQGTWRSRDAANTPTADVDSRAADVRASTGALGVMGGPRLTLGRDVWVLPTLGVEVAYLARQTAWVVDGLVATQDATFVGVAARARVTIDTPSWCLTGRISCAVRGRFTLAALGALFIRRPVWAVQGDGETMPLDIRWAFFHPGAELGWRAEF